MTEINNSIPCFSSLRFVEFFLLIKCLKRKMTKSRIVELNRACLFLVIIPLLFLFYTLSISHSFSLP